ADKDKLSNTNSKTSLDLSKQLLSLLDNTKRERVNLDVLINVEKAMEPLYTSKPELDRSGMGFTVMKSFMDDVEVSSVKDNG
ncbi:hypothetical protein ACTPEM_26835, partial [Clostridioides difficile]